MELTLPDEPVTLAPGVPTRVPVQLRNPYAGSLDLRVFLARGRAERWATVDPAGLRLGPGETAEVTVVLRTPPEQPPSSSLVPFTVHAEEAATGEPAGFATALLKVALPVPVTGKLVPKEGPSHEYDLRLANDTRVQAPLRVTAELDPPAGSVTVEPDAVLLDPGQAAVVAIRAKPRRPFSGSPRSFAVVVKVSDAYDPDREPFLTEVATGKRKPRVPTAVLFTTAIVLAVGASTAILLTGDHDFLPFGKKAATSTTAPVAKVTIGKPYALVDVFPHKGADGGRGVADAALAKLQAAGMPVRLVDSLASDTLADDPDGYWVLLQDGFGSPPAAEQYCAQWRSVAPKCKVTS
ncbi:COG1470 family protein [Paractinoplanes ferrugineus]|uniref:COG1470 family protein n=1 Tax=Paractinoplanes ferrugineus TaxID=113564 RepID=UPI001940A0E6|nr:hypothetical protein [Actinoplanes ferrugineus]